MSIRSLTGRLPDVGRSLVLISELLLEAHAVDNFPAAVDFESNLLLVVKRSGIVFGIFGIRIRIRIVRIVGVLGFYLSLCADSVEVVAEDIVDAGLVECICLSPAVSVEVVEGIVLGLGTAGESDSHDRWGWLGCRRISWKRESHQSSSSRQYVPILHCCPGQ